MPTPSPLPSPEQPSAGSEGRLPRILTALVGIAIVVALRPLARPPVASPAPDDREPREAHQPGRGRGAEHPAQIPPRGWWDIAQRVFDEVVEDRIVAVAAGVAFFGLLALFPAVGAFVALYGLVADPAAIGGHLSALSDVMPGGAIDIVGDQVKRIVGKGSTALGVTFFTGLGMSLWSANAGMKAMFDALNVAYQEREKRNFLVLNVWSLGFTFGAIALLVVAMSAIVVIPVVLSFLGFGGATEWVIWAGRWPALFLVILVSITVLYRYGPSRRRARWLWLSPGAMLASLGWIGLSMLFSWYVAHFGSYNETYGSLGAVIGFMTWLWLSAIVILVGAEISAETEHQTARDTTRGPPKPLGERGAHMADTIGRAQ